MRINKGIKLIYPSFFLALTIIQNQVLCQTRESLIKAGFVEKFTHFIQWPEGADKENASDVFVIKIIGENTLGEALVEIFSKVKVKDKLVKIDCISSVDEINNCSILFISGSEKDNLNKILAYTTGKPILTVSDSKGYGENGVIINMFRDGDFIRYEINKKSLEKSGLVINSLLLSYAKILK